MPQRLALITASVVATIVLTVGLVAAGFVPLPRPDQAVEAASNVSTAVTDDALQPSAEPEIVYIKPAPKPKTVVVEQPVAAKNPVAKKAPSGPRTTATPARHDDDDAHERSASGRERERDDD